MDFNTNAISDLLWDMGYALEVRNTIALNLPPDKLIKARKGIEKALAENPDEASCLVKELHKGRIDGKFYVGDCCCLRGALVKCELLNRGETEKYDRFISKRIGHAAIVFDYGLPKTINYASPEEQFFLLIQEFDTPENNIASKLAVEWIEAWMEKQNASTIDAGCASEAVPSSDPA